MRIKYFKKKLIWLTEKDYKKILTRFNHRKYKKEEDSRFGIPFLSEIHCPLCNKYNSCEEGCQLNKFKDHKNLFSTKNGCEDLISDILKVDDPSFFIYHDEIGYYPSEEKPAKKELDKILRFLLSFEQSYRTRRDLESEK